MRVLEDFVHAVAGVVGHEDIARLIDAQALGVEESRQRSDEFETGP